MKTISMAFALAALGPLAAAPAWADDGAANEVYGRMADSYAALDPEALETVYAPDATYLSRNPKAGIDPRDAIRKGMHGFHEQLRKNGGSVRMKFRIVERKRYGDVIVDNGYVQSAIRMARDAPEEVTTAKFVTVIARQPQGHWAFVTDADSDTPAARFEQALPVPGLRFDA